jgi:hypothetical protein
MRRKVKFGCRQGPRVAECWGRRLLRLQLRAMSKELDANPRSLAGNPPQRYIDLASLTEAVPGIHCAGGEEIPPT